MHELGIATEIAERVQAEITRRHLNNLRAVGVRVGALSALDPEALAFGFTCVCKETPLEGVRLDIEWVSASVRCEICGHRWTTDQPDFICPACKTCKPVIEQGYELDIAYLETDDPEV
jgi:hydrogenase nickel incorporation protein HypA/HybF